MSKSVPLCSAKVVSFCCFLNGFVGGSGILARRKMPWVFWGIRQVSLVGIFVLLGCLAPNNGKRSSSDGSHDMIDLCALTRIYPNFNPG